MSRLKLVASAETTSLIYNITEYLNELYYGDESGEFPEVIFAKREFFGKDKSIAVHRVIDDRVHWIVDVNDTIESAIRDMFPKVVFYV